MRGHVSEGDRDPLVVLIRQKLALQSPEASPKVLE